jgi:hypothetical protein
MPAEPNHTLAFRNACLPEEAGLTSIDHAFPDGGLWRIEIPSVEGPDALRAVLTEARRLEVPIHRVSQGSGIGLMTDSEIASMRQIAADEDIDLCLFLGPRANWDIGAQRFTAAGTGARARGSAAVNGCVADARRAADLGVRSVLVADEGVLALLSELRTDGELPADMQLKMSVLAAPLNPVSFRLLARLGADTINVGSDLSIADLAAMRRAADTTIDFYVEAPDNIGGFIRYHEIAEIVRAAAPVYLKFGLRNAADIYPAGQHLCGTVLDTARERVRRARLGIDTLLRLDPELAATMSDLGYRAKPTRPTLLGVVPQSRGAGPKAPLAATSV